MSSGCKVGAMPSAKSFEQFEAEHRARGLDEVLSALACAY